MKYQNKRNGKIAIDVTQTVEQKEKYKTVTLTFEDGAVQDITTATFKRWYKKIEDDVEVEQTDDTKTETDDAYVDEVMKQKEELGIDVPELNPDDVEVVDAEPEKKQKKKREPVDAQAQVNVYQDVMDFVNTLDQMTIKEWAEYYFSIKIAKKAVAEVRIRKNGLMAVYTRVEIADAIGLEYETVKNYYLPAVVKNTTLETLKKIFNEVM